MAAVPYTVLQVNATIVKWKLSHNVFVELGVESIKGYMKRWTFPEMRQLTNLELVDCRIPKIHKDTFFNLPNLRRLDLRTCSSPSRMQWQLCRLWRNSTITE